MDEHNLSSKASGATPAGALTRPREDDFTHIRGSRLYVHPYTLGDPPRREERELLLLNTDKGYKGSPARSHQKIQTRCHLRGNFPCLGEKRTMKKDTEPLADATARLLGMRGPAPDHAGPTGCFPRKPSSSVFSTEDHAGGRAGGQRPPHRLPESNLVA